jgi:hypothetical protein
MTGLPRHPLLPNRHPNEPTTVKNPKRESEREKSPNPAYHTRIPHTISNIIININININPSEPGSLPTNGKATYKIPQPT